MDQFRHFQMIGGFHRYCGIRNLLVDGLFSVEERFIAENDLSVSLVWDEILASVLTDESSETFA